MNRHAVRLFARYAELLQSDQVEVSLPNGSTVADLVLALRALPGGASLPAQPFVAINMTQASLNAPLHAGDELALLPPLAGG
jgi:molybdopterin synthase sulfur carrier subunit